jgi:iron(III) transport system ATP-binding protein
MKRADKMDVQVRALELEALTLSYRSRDASQTVLTDLSLQIDKGDIACLLGPSGCGKTTVLRAIAGFQPVQSGRIVLMQREVSSPAVHVPPERRKIGMVFQDYALFPHLDVAGNIGFGLHAMPAAERKQRVAELLELVGLAALAHRSPHELSGGQQQRVALARALAPGPELLLMDEPFSNLDITLRERLAVEVRDLLKETGTTAIIVTHDQQEAFAVADRIAVLAEGRLQQWGAAMDLYHRPANPFVAGFIGEGVMISGRMNAQGGLHNALGTFLPGEISGASMNAGDRIGMLVRPDDILHDDLSPLKAQVISKAFRGAHFLYTLALSSGEHVISLVSSHHDHAIGELIGIRMEIDHVICFPEPEEVLNQ